MAALHRLAGGRVVLGIGLGDSAVHTIGVARANIAELEEDVRSLQDLFDTDETTYRGAHMSCPYAKRPVPIYISASGPRGLALAGELADGVMVGWVCSPTWSILRSARSRSARNGPGGACLTWTSGG
jgi:5,10-methylenetetrahydromethanopterin reductase